MDYEEFEDLVAEEDAPVTSLRKRWSPWAKAGRSLMKTSFVKLLDHGIEKMLNDLENVVLPFGEIPNPYDPSVKYELIASTNGSRCFGNESGVFFICLGETVFCIKNNMKLVPLSKTVPSVLIAKGIPLKLVDRRAIRRAFGSYCVRLVEAGRAKHLKSNDIYIFPSPFHECLIAWLGLKAWDRKLIYQLAFARYAWSVGLLRRNLGWKAFRSIDPFEKEDLEFGIKEVAENSFLK